MGREQQQSSFSTFYCTRRQQLGSPFHKRLDGTSGRNIAGLTTGPRSGPFRVRIEAGQSWVGAEENFQITRINLCSVELQYRKEKNQNHPIRNEAQLNCVSLRSQLDYEVAWSAVKGQDERYLTTPLTALHATGVTAMVKQNQKPIKEPPRRP